MGTLKAIQVSPMKVIEAPRCSSHRLQTTSKAPIRAILTPAIIAFVIIAFTSHYAMGAFDVVWSLWLEHLGASMTFIGLTWIAFSVPMLLSFVGGIVADRYSRYWLFVGGYTLSAFAWIFYGVTTNMT